MSGRLGRTHLALHHLSTHRVMLTQCFGSLFRLQKTRSYCSREGQG